MLFLVWGLLPGLAPETHAQQLDRHFAPPLLWERFTDYTFSAGPYRSFADGRGGVFLVGNGGADVVDGVQFREPIRMREVDGTVDATFRSAVSGGFAMATQPDGKILLTSNSGQASVVYRLLPSGDRDATFIPVGFDQGIRHLAVLPGGKILVVVWGNSFGSYVSPRAIAVPKPTVIRLHADGGVDTFFQRPAFAGSGYLFAPPVVDSAGRIYLGGQFTGVNGVARANVVRLLGDGAVDESFGGSLTIPGGLSGTVRELLVQADDRVVVVGDLRIPMNSATADRTAAIRFDANGQFDAGFIRHKVTTLGLRDYPRAVAPAPDGRFVIMGGGLRRFNRDGSLDATFTATDFPKLAFWMTAMADGRYLVPGANSEEGLAVFGADGAPDPGFKTGGFGRTMPPSSHAFLADGRLAIAGDFNRVGQTPQLGLAILDGSTGEARPPQPDLTPAAPPQAIMDWGGSAPLVAAGLTNTVWFLASVMETNYASRTLFGRVGADGAWDPAIGVREVSWPDPLASATDLESLPDGRLLLVGNSAQAAVDGQLLQRWRADGTKDVSFQGADPALLAQWARVVYHPQYNSITRLDLGSLRFLGRLGNDHLLASVITADGRARLFRVNHDGQIDPGFAVPEISGLSGYLNFVEVRNPRTGELEQPEDGIMVYEAGMFLAASALPDGRCYVAGRFLEWGGKPLAHLARLTPDGAFDPTFPGVQLECRENLFVEPSLQAVAVDEEGRVYIAGTFDQVNQHPAPGLARLLPDGSLDTGFASPLRLDPAYPQSVGLHLAGDQLYGLGEATDGETRRTLWRLEVGAQLVLRYEFGPSGPLSLSVPSSPTQATVLQASEDLVTWRDVFTNPAGALPGMFQESGFGTGHTFFRLKQ